MAPLRKQGSRTRFRAFSHVPRKPSNLLNQLVQIVSGTHAGKNGTVIAIKKKMLEIALDDNNSIIRVSANEVM